MPRLDAIGVVASDLGASVAFYRLLGLEFPEYSDDGSAGGHVEATLPGGIRFMLDTVDIIRSMEPEWTPPSGGHGMGIAFLCDSPADVDDVYAKLIAQGVPSHKEPWDAFWGQRYAQIKDPDGNIVDLFAPL